MKSQSNRKHFSEGKGRFFTLWLTGGGTVLLLVGGILGWVLHTPLPKPSVTALREDPANYKFIDPILLLQAPEDTATPQFQSLKNSMIQYIADAKKKSQASDISVYFRQLNSDRWLGINQDQNYAPASMLKVVSLIAFERRVQETPALSSTAITIAAGDINTDSNQDYYPPQNPIQVGRTYSAQDLINHMIIDSDNNAAFTLDQVTGDKMLNKTYKDLGVPNPNDTFAIDFISPHLYSRIFRSLYNGGFLSDSISEQALELMSKTNFTKGLVAGVPAGTTVSHKFGERTIRIQDLDGPQPTTQTTRELHDCGIVYAPQDPYLLCVMTKGSDFPTLQAIISDLSRITWNSIAQLDHK